MAGDKKVPAPQPVRRVQQPKPDGQRGYAPPPRQPKPPPSQGTDKGNKK